MIRHAEAVVRTADELLDDFAARVGVFPRGSILISRCYAFALLERHEEALDAAELALSQSQVEDDEIHVMMAWALENQGREEEAAAHVERALKS